MPSLKQAMILAAGFSTRMRPLTNRTPKPLLPFWDRQILDFTLDYLRSFQVETFSMNAHFETKKLQSKISSISDFSMELFAEKNILGTGGGIANMQSFITEDIFAVVNCDFFCDVNLTQAADFHLAKKALATMVLLERPDAKKYGVVGVNQDNRIVSFPRNTPPKSPTHGGMFSGIHIFSREIFREMPKGSSAFCINSDVYTRLIEKKAPVFGYFPHASWHDLGELKPYAQTQFDLLATPFSWMKSPQGTKLDRKNLIFVGNQVSLGPGCKVGENVVIGEGCNVGKGVTLNNTILFPQARAKDKALLDSVILAPGIEPVAF